ncbi:MAG: uncharacterized protein A8A55_1051 [Amphiamblys sp. WSBS2006]|nr:MAG: uncharacterized protein A8A55_1051 [Amphiamblys sp. WSBS2006]
MKRTCGHGQPAPKKKQKAGGAAKKTAKFLAKNAMAIHLRTARGVWASLAEQGDDAVLDRDFFAALDFALAQPRGTQPVAGLLADFLLENSRFLPEINSLLAETGRQDRLAAILTRKLLSVLETTETDVCTGKTLAEVSEKHRAYFDAIEGILKGREVQEEKEVLFDELGSFAVVFFFRLFHREAFTEEIESSLGNLLLEKTPLREDLVCAAILSGVFSGKDNPAESKDNLFDFSFSPRFLEVARTLLFLETENTLAYLGYIFEKRGLFHKAPWRMALLFELVVYDAENCALRKDFLKRVLKSLLLPSQNKICFGRTMYELALNTEKQKSIFSEVFTETLIEDESLFSCVGALKALSWVPKNKFTHNLAKKTLIMKIRSSKDVEMIKEYITALFWADIGGGIFVEAILGIIQGWWATEEHDLPKENTASFILSAIQSMETRSSSARFGIMSRIELQCRSRNISLRFWNTPETVFSLLDFAGGCVPECMRGLNMLLRILQRVRASDMNLFSAIMDSPEGIGRLVSFEEKISTLDKKQHEKISCFIGIHLFPQKKTTGV